MNPLAIAASKGMEIGFLAFLSLFFLQWIFWRFLKIKREMLCLFLLYFALPASLIAFILCQHHVSTNLLAATIFYLSLSMAYVLSFPAIQAQSPSLEMLLILHAQKKQGCTPEQLAHELSKISLVEARKKDLYRDKLLALDPQGLPVLSNSGLFLAKLFLAYRKLFQLENNG